MRYLFILLFVSISFADQQTFREGDIIDGEKCVYASDYETAEADDITETEANGSIDGATHISATSTTSGHYSFDGGDSIRLTDNMKGDAELASGALSVWAYPKSAGSVMRVIGFEGVLTIDTATPSNFRANVYDGASDNLDVGTYSINNWYHIVSTWNGSTHSVYLNGDFVTSASQGSPSLDSLNRAWYVGAAFNGGSKWNGLIDDFLIYGKYLLADDVTELYNQGKPRHP